AVAPTLRAWRPVARAKRESEPARLRPGLARAASPNRRRDSCGSPRRFGVPLQQRPGPLGFWLVSHRGASRPAPLPPPAACHNAASCPHSLTVPRSGAGRIPAAPLFGGVRESLQVFLDRDLPSPASRSRADPVVAAGTVGRNPPRTRDRT